MRQVLNDFLGVLCLASSRLTPAKRAKEVLREMWPNPQSVPSPLQALLPTILLGPSEGPTSGGKAGKLVLESSRTRATSHGPEEA